MRALITFDSYVALCDTNDYHSFADSTSIYKYLNFIIATLTLCTFYFVVYLDTLLEYQKPLRSIFIVRH